ncbi:MAG: acireductone synthase [Acidobacteria bacterium]|nr:acireductone synthase [Acidobacteriota bacterium]
MPQRGILLDIEGTTTPIAFVYDVLFPFARRRVAAYLKDAGLGSLKLEHDEDVRQGHDPPPWSAEPAAYIHWLMDQDRKSPALKDIQGKIWLEGYQSGELHGEVFQDVPPALERWHTRKIDIRIFSSGSILAQRLLFSTTAAGDLTRFLSGYFDTTTGPKNELSSYTQIANAFGMPAPDILFISDATRELDAARAAGMRTLLCVRPGNHPQPPHDHPTITSFETIV